MEEDLRKAEFKYRILVEQIPPIIAITANALKGDQQKILDAGCDLYMSKPINIQELLDIVESFVSKEA